LRTPKATSEPTAGPSRLCGYLSLRGIVVIGEEQLGETGPGTYLALYHELAHAVEDYGLPDQREQLKALYETAKANGKWFQPSGEPAYAMLNYHEYFAIASEAFLDLGTPAYDSINAGVVTPAALRDYDPAIYGFLAAIYC
jgi:hypothetical protein